MISTHLLGPRRNITPMSASRARIKNRRQGTGGVGMALLPNHPQSLRMIVRRQNGGSCVVERLALVTVYVAILLTDCGISKLPRIYFAGGRKQTVCSRTYR